jgi:CheY-like chemotaxis protein
VQLMGGELELDSSLDTGSRFFFALPLAAGDAAAAKSGMAAAQDYQLVDRLAPEYAVCALVVDDLPENRQVLAQLLRSIGVEVEVAAHGRQALARIEARMPEIVFMDIWMPEMDGREAMRQIRQRWGAEGPKVVATTASVLLHEREAYIKDGFDDFIAKPLRDTAIFACLASILRVQFIYREPASAMDWRDVVLPAALGQQLRTALELGRINEMERGLEAVRALGHDHLATQLEDLLHGLDLERIKVILEGLDYE